MMKDGIIIFDMPVGNDLPTVIEKSSIRPINLHSAIWGIFHMYSKDDSLDEMDRNLFTRARNALDGAVFEDSLYYLAMSKKFIIQNDVDNFDKIVELANDVLTIK